MSSEELHHLIKMLNQISINQPKNISDDEAAVKVAAHVNSFWAKSMRQKVHAQQQAIVDQLNPIAQKALSQIHGETG